MKIHTVHTQIGYTCNVEIIARALRERFGVDDNSHVETAVAAHIWSAVCGRCSEKTEWGTEEIAHAIAQIEARIARIKSVALARV